MDHDREKESDRPEEPKKDQSRPIEHTRDRDEGDEDELDLGRQQSEGNLGNERQRNPARDAARMPHA